VILNRAVLYLCFGLLVSSVPATICAGPPYITDDPEPVDYQHWEVYAASIFTKQSDAWTATAPHLEVNYGVVPNLQLHTILPMTLYAPAEGPSSYGYGDTEFGAKYRLVQEGKWLPEVGTFPLLEVPTGSHERNLGSGHLETFLPLWLQKSLGPWTAYGGGGYWINPGAHNHNWWFSGLVVQCEVLPGFTPGVEVFHGTSQVIGEPSELGVNFGVIWNLSELQHVLFSAGPALKGSNQLQGYFAYQLTFGPHN
jgi:hypothetical protein